MRLGSFRFAAAMLAGTAALVATTDGALAHGDVGPGGREILTAWHLELSFLVPFVVAVGAYCLGTRMVWAKYSRWRGIRRRDVACFATGMVALFLAVSSPLDALAGELVSAHMLQHVILLFVVAPLLVMSRANLAIGALLPRRVTVMIRSRANAAAHPLAAWVLMMGVIWGWHIPAAYDTATRSPVIHGLEHASMLGAAIAWWHVALHRAGRRAFPFGLAIPWVFTTMLGMSALSALMAFSATPWYPEYVHPAGEWPVGAVTDQQLAGLVMWSISNALQLAVVLWLVARWLIVEERRADRHVRQRALVR